MKRKTSMDTICHAILVAAYLMAASAYCGILLGESGHGPAPVPEATLDPRLEESAKG
ncbi:hypothetical protein [Sphingomonas sp. LT1P40]|uniref:hypothetical protein n=1 Tax=Alteristakelama amylovorans TaxID=3096166 RepID=UPI002FC90DB0